VNDDDERTRTNIHALSGIRTHGLSVKAIKAYASDRTITGTGMAILIRSLFPRFLQAMLGQNLELPFIFSFFQLISFVCN
jgi:hypothetical protein